VHIIEGTKSEDKQIKNGIAFSTCITLNNLICHFSPISSDKEGETTIEEGDVVKVQLGAHFNGFPVIVAHTIVVGSKADGPKADVIIAAHKAAEACCRLIKPKNKNSQLTDVVRKITEAYGVKSIEGSVSYQIEREKLEGAKQIVFNPADNIKNTVKTTVFEEGEAYFIEIVASTGDSRLNNSTYRTTLYKRTDLKYPLKMKSSKVLLTEINKTHNKFPFNIRDTNDLKNAKAGVIECSKSRVLDSYPVFEDKKGSFVAHFAFTILLLPGSEKGLVLSGLSKESVKFLAQVKSDKVIDGDLAKLLDEPVDMIY